jgi:hypothetical protein
MMQRTSEPSAHDEQAGSADDDRLRKLVARLARPNPAGGATIERATIMASGTDSQAMLAWVVAHAGEPEDLAPPSAGRGLHSARLNDRAGATARKPLRYVLPPGVLVNR